LTLLFRALALLPLVLLHGIGTVCGWLAFVLSATYRTRFLANARQAGYALGDVAGAVGAAGRLLAEVPRLWFGAGARVHWSGDHLIEEALAAGRGIVFLTPHLGCFEITAQGYAARFGRITVLYRPARKAWLRPLVDTARARRNLATAPTTMAGVKQMLKALQAGEAVGLLPDQVPPQGLGAWAPFFGRDAYTSTLPARLATHTDACVLLAWGERLSWGRGFRIHLRPWTGGLGASPQEGAALVNARMESLIRECPAQYLWGYARYKQPRETG
jgi:KDO2-lipid IV(A) lauroyltransferase